MNANQHPVQWQVSADGNRMIGHIVFRRSVDGDEILGLKVSGGRLSATGRRAAFIEKVKADSLADVEGLLQPGNGHDSRTINTSSHTNPISYPIQYVSSVLILSHPLMLLRISPVYVSAVYMCVCMSVPTPFVVPHPPLLSCSDMSVVRSDV